MNALKLLRVLYVFGIIPSLLGSCIYLWFAHYFNKFNPSYWFLIVIATSIYYSLSLYKNAKTVVEKIPNHISIELLKYKKVYFIHLSIQVIAVIILAIFHFKQFHFSNYHSLLLVLSSILIIVAYHNFRGTPCMKNLIIALGWLFISLFPFLNYILSFDFFLWLILLEFFLLIFTNSVMSDEKDITADIQFKTKTLATILSKKTLYRFAIFLSLMQLLILSFMGIIASYWLHSSLTTILFLLLFLLFLEKNSQSSEWYIVWDLFFLIRFLLFLFFDLYFGLK